MVLDINRPKGLQRRLARKRSNAQSPNAQSQSGANSSAARRDRSILPTGRRPAQAKTGNRTASPQRDPRSQESDKTRPANPRPESTGQARNQAAKERRSGARSEAAKRSGLLPGLQPRQRPSTPDQRQLRSRGSESRRSEPRRADANRSEARRPDARHPDARRSDARRSDFRLLESRHPDTRPLEARSLESRSADQRLTAKSAQARSQRTSPLTYLVRLLIVGVGVGAIVGTAISIWNPSLRNPAPVSSTTNAVPQQRKTDAVNGSTGVQATISNVRLGREMSELTVKVTPLMHNLTDLVPGVFVIDLDNGNFFNFNGSATLSSASMIKLPVLIAFFQDVDAGKIKLDEVLNVQKEDIAEGSGEMQYAGAGAQYSALETATNMIIISDNTATNMLIRRMGGIQVLNQRFRQWGLQQTLLRKPLPDLEGTNTTSPKELVSLMALLNDGKLVSMKSRDRIFEIMHRTQTDTLLPSVMSPGSTVAHKTGDIGSLVGDVGLVDLPTGRRYAIAAMVKRPNNDSRAQDLIRQIAALVYENFGGQPILAPSPIAPTQTMPQQPGMPMPSPGVTAPGLGTTTPGYVAPVAPGMPNPTGMTNPAPMLPTPMPTQTPMPAAPEAIPQAVEPDQPEAVSEPEAVNDTSDPDDAATSEDAQTDDSTP